MSRLVSCSGSSKNGFRRSSATTPTTRADTSRLGLSHLLLRRSDEAQQCPSRVGSTDTMRCGESPPRNHHSVERRVSPFLSHTTCPLFIFPARHPHTRRTTQLPFRSSSTGNLRQQKFRLKHCRIISAQPAGVAATCSKHSTHFERPSRLSVG